MGPFPHTAPRSQISDENPVGTNGFEFVEFAHETPDELRHLFSSMGFALTGRHKHTHIELWQQGDVTYILNAAPNSFAARFVDQPSPCAPSMGWSSPSHAAKGYISSII